MKKVILNLLLTCGVCQLANAQSGVNTSFDSYYSFSNNFNRKEGGASSNGGGVNFVLDRNNADKSAIQITGENGVVIAADANRAFTNAGFTFSAWINPSNFTMNPGLCTGVGSFNNTFDVRMIVESANTTAPYDKDFRVFLKNGKVSIDINTNVGIYSHTFTNGSSPSLNQWQQVALTLRNFSGPNGLQSQLVYFLNGAAQDSVTFGSQTEVVFTGKQIEIGATNSMGSANCGNTFQAFQGKLDEFMFLSRASLNEEIVSKYNNDRVHTNVEISSLLDNMLAYFPIGSTSEITCNANLGFLNILSTTACYDRSITRLVPYTYTPQATSADRFGNLNSAFTQGAVNASVSLNFNGFRYENGNKILNFDSTATIALWVKNTGATWNNTTIIDASNDLAANFKWTVNNAGNVVVNLGAASYTFANQNIPLNTWAHLAVTIDGKNKTVKLFINGQLADTFTANTKFKFPSNNTGDVFFMTSPMYYQSGTWQGGGNGLVGSFDEVRFFKTALTNTEIAQIVSPTGLLKPNIAVKSTWEYGDRFINAQATYSNFDTTIFAANAGLLTAKGIGTSSVKIQLAATDFYTALDTTVSITVIKKNLEISPLDNFTINYGEAKSTFNKINYRAALVNQKDTLTITGSPQWTNLDKTEVGTYDLIYAGGLTSPLYTFSDYMYVTNELKIVAGVAKPIAYDSVVNYADTFNIVTFDAKIQGNLTLGLIQNNSDPVAQLENGKLIALRAGEINVNVSFIPTSSNYLPYNKLIKLKVNPAPLTITVANQNINYGYSLDTYYNAYNNSGAYKVAGLKNEDVLGGFYFNYVTPQVVSNYKPETSPRGSYAITIDTAQFKIDAGANVYRYYKITTIIPGELLVSGNKSQAITGIQICGTVDGGKEILSKGGCTPTFVAKNPNDVPFTIQHVISSDVIFSNNTQIPVLFEVVSGPATVSGSTFTLTGAEGTVSIKISAAGNADYNPAEDIILTFEVSNSVIINAVEDSNLEINFSVYPNPVSKTLNISEFAEIYDLLGNKVAEGNEKLDVSSLSKGIYLVKAGNSVLKIVKE